MIAGKVSPLVIYERRRPGSTLPARLAPQMAALDAKQTSFGLAGYQVAALQTGLLDSSPGSKRLDPRLFITYRLIASTV
jgi:hypothetical protein